MDKIIKQYFKKIGKIGGSKTSERKKASSAENGKKGGRPPKLPVKAIRKSEQD